MLQYQELARVLHAEREREIRDRLRGIAGMASGPRHPRFPEWGSPGGVPVSQPAPTTRGSGRRVIANPAFTG